jgi:hypothetical protein
MFMGMGYALIIMSFSVPENHVVPSLPLPRRQVWCPLRRVGALIGKAGEGWGQVQGRGQKKTILFSCLVGQVVNLGWISKSSVNQVTLQRSDVRKHLTPDMNFL